MKVHVPALPGPHDEKRVMAAWLSTFSQPGTYEVSLLKAAQQDEFERWYLQRLAEAARTGITDAIEATWMALDDLLRRRGVESPSELDYWELQRNLFDLTRVPVAQLSGMRVPTEVSERLVSLGWGSRGLLEFPVIAYRMGLIYERLATVPPAEFGEVLRLARELPLSSQERLAIEAVRRQAGTWLQPIFDDAAQVWTAEREIVPLRRVLEGGLRARTPAREIARELWKAQRGQGVMRDAERVALTEIARARALGSWAHDSKRWNADTLVYRQTQSHPCRGCLRLWRNEDGTPRVYKASELEAGEALGVNRGNWRNWHPVIGPTHPNCLCAPAAEYHSAMRHIFAHDAERYRQMIDDFGVFKEAA